MKIASLIRGRRRNSPDESFHINTYGVEITHFTWLKYIRYRLYHWYDMHIPIAIPGWKRLEGFLKDHGAEYRIGADDEPPRLRDRVLMWTVSQDIRCYEYSRQLNSYHIPITEEQYNAIRDLPHKPDHTCD